MKKKWFWLVAVTTLIWLSGTQSPAQIAPASQGKPSDVITRVVEVKNADPYQLKSMLDPIAKANGTIVTVDEKNKLLLLAGNPDRLVELETLIRLVDVAPAPSRTVELTAYLLAADGAAAAAQNIPAQIEPAIKQLRSTFNYKTYQLLDTIFLRNRTGEAGTTRGFLPAPASEPTQSKSGAYVFAYTRSYVSRDEKGEVIHLDHLVLELPNGSISTNVDLRSGQMVVVGKTNYERDSSSALIAIITARLID